MEIKDLHDIIEKIVEDKLIYLKHYIGEVIEILDSIEPTQKGWVKVNIQELGWSPDFQSAGAWVKPRFLNSLLIPKIGDQLDIGFMNADPDRPVYYGKINENEGQLPVNFTGTPTDQLIYDSPDGTGTILHDELANLLTIGDKLHKEAARKDDATLSNLTYDATFWAFMTSLVTTFNTHTHAVTTAPGTTAIPIPTLGAAPTKLDGIIDEGSSQVQIGDK